MAGYFLEMKGISKAFTGTQALDKVDFSLKNGEVMALLGENGAGKSTLMKVLMGIYHQDEGQIFLNGKLIENRSPYEALQKGIGIVPQELNMVPELSVAENIFLSSPVKNGSFVSWNDTYVNAAKEIAKLDVDIDPHVKIGTLSAAFQQIVSIARTLAMGSSLIILDEPTASLTTNETNQLFKVIRKLRDDGKSIILITHHLDEVQQIANRVSIMRDGLMIKVADVEELSIDEIIFHMANRRVEKNKRIIRSFSNEDILIVKNFTRHREFTNITFNVKKGELLGIAGLIGSGRTELFSCIYGLTRKHSGELIFDNKPIKIGSPYSAIRHGIGYVPEERGRLGIFPLLSVFENMMIPSYDQNKKAGIIRYKKIKEDANHEIENLRIKTPSSDTLIRNLSGGNQQKVVLARWMQKKVKLLILDEPTRGIDVRAKGEIYAIIRKMVDMGITIIVISSEMEELLTVSDRIVVMFNGEIKGSMIPNENSTREDILKIALQLNGVNGHE